MIVYHVTFLRALEAIVDGGLLSGRGHSGFGGGYGAHSTGRVFLTAWDGVSYWASRMEAVAHHSSDNIPEDGWVPVVLAVDVPRKRLRVDTLGARDATEDAWYTETPIPPTRIAVWGGADWEHLPEVDVEALWDQVRDASEAFTDGEGDDETGWSEVDMDLLLPTAAIDDIDEDVLFPPPEESDE